jgi:A/G-specific adenine glycosylase
MPIVSKSKIKQLVATVLSFYEAHGRHDLPWRHTRDPYAILVSEVMLQQTQVARVVPKYEAFLGRFPTVCHLADAPLCDVLTLWQGLGYNRRAKFLHETAQRVVEEYNGAFPCEHETLRLLPGVGHYTAGAVCAFAYNVGVPIAETNIRTVIIHECFVGMERVSDNDVLAVVEKTLEHAPVSAREWYYACMDYGAHLKECGVLAHRNSAHHRKQSRFIGSNRQVRGAVLRALLAASAPLSLERICAVLDVSAPQNVVAQQCEALCAEGLICNEGTAYWRIA